MPLPLPDASTAARCALATAGVDAAAVLALGVMYAVEVPKGGPYPFGTANDALGAAGQVLAMPVMVAVTEELPAGSALRGFLPVGLAGCAAGAASGALLVARVLPFAPSTAISIVAMELQAAWMAAVHHGLLRGSRFPPSLARLGRLIGAGMLAGAAVAGPAFLLPADSAARRALLAAGVTPAAAAWCAWPVWFGLVARHYRARATAVGAG